MSRYLLLLGVTAGAVAATATYAIPPVAPWWWAAGLLVACLVWVARPAAEAAVDLIRRRHTP